MKEISLMKHAAWLSSNPVALKRTNLIELTVRLPKTTLKKFPRFSKKSVSLQPPPFKREMGITISLRHFLLSLLFYFSYYAHISLFRGSHTTFVFFFTSSKPCTCQICFHLFDWFLELYRNLCFIYMRASHICCLQYPSHANFCCICLIGSLSMQKRERSHTTIDTFFWASQTSSCTIWF